MKQFKLSFANRSILEQIAIARRVADGIAKLPAEHRETLALHPAAASVVEAVDAHAEVENLKLALKAAKTKRAAKVRAMRDHTTGAALLIRVVTGGDPAAMLGAGLGIVKDKQPVGQPDAPGRFRADATDFEGHARLGWKRTVRRCDFIIEATTDPAATTGWKRVATSFKQTCEVTGLESGVKYWFRVSASNAHGQGPWSQAVCVRVK